MEREKRIHIKLVFLVVFVVFTMILSACNTKTSAVDTKVNVEIPIVVADKAVVVEGNLVPIDYITVFVASGGTVADIIVEDGDLVKKGDVLIRLGDREPLEAAITAAELELEMAEQLLADLEDITDLAINQAWLSLLDAEAALTTAQQTWRDFEDSDLTDELDAAELELIESKDALEQAQQDFGQYEDLDENNATRVLFEDALDIAQRSYDDAVWKRDTLLIQVNREEALLKNVEDLKDEAQRQYDAVKSGPDPDALALAEARLRNAEASLAAANAGFDRFDLIAPFDGTIVSINVSEGEFVTPGKNAVLLADFSTWVVETRDLTELEVVKIQEGDDVTVIADALPEQLFSGEVDQIADVFQERLGDITYQARILLRDADPSLRWGMTVTVDFGERD